MAKRHVKKCPTSMAIKEMKIKTTIRFHSCWNGYYQEHNNKCWHKMWGGEKEPSYTVGGNVN
jgi:hypothetical protein